MRAIASAAPALTENQILLKVNTMKTLTAFNIAELVPTSSNQLTPSTIEPDLSHDLIEYYQGLIAPEEIERNAIIDEVKIIDGRVHITWHGYLPVDMKISIHVAIDRYIEITTSTKIAALVLRAMN